MNDFKIIFDGDVTSASWTVNLEQLKLIRDLFLPRAISLVESGAFDPSKVKDFEYDSTHRPK
jgi:hypothetical protein